MEWILNILIYLPLLGAGVILLLPKLIGKDQAVKQYRLVALLTTGAQLLITLYFYFFAFDPSLQLSDPNSPYHKDIFNQNKTYVFYCASAWRSALSAKTSIEMGLNPVVHLEGGFSAWKKAGQPIEEVE